MTATTQVATRRRDPLAICSFFIGLFLLGPVQGGLLDPGLRAGHYGTVLLLFLIFFAVVFVPFWISVRRRRREKLSWGSRGFLVGAGVILGLDVLWFAATIIYQLFR
jgi:hypothetical protein